MADNRPRSRPGRVDSGDGGVFAVIGLACVAFVVLLGVAVAVSRWFGVGAAHLTFELGAALILIAALVRILPGGRR